MIKKTKDILGVTTLEDISTLILQSHDLDETLNNIVSLVAKRMRTEVCSIYLLDPDGETLRLRATKGLSRRAVGKVSLKIGEGLTGLAVQEKHAVAIQDPENHPRYRYFKETREERFHSFLGIPLFDRDRPVGVVVLQTKERRQFSSEEISALSTIAFQTSSIVVNARLLDSIREKEEESKRYAQELAKTRQDLRDRDKPQDSVAEVALRGRVAYPGVVSGTPHILDESLGFADFLDEQKGDIAAEHQCLNDALEETRIQTLFLQKRVAERLSEADAAIFHTHLMILEDRTVLENTRSLIEQGHSAAYALKKVYSDYIAAFDRMDDPYLRERAADMEDLGRRLLSNLTGQGENAFELKTEGIVVAKQILPSAMATLDHEKILGIVTEAGEQNSHAVIMAKSLGIPAIVDVKGVTKNLKPDDFLILDANSGCLYINPPQQVIEEYQRLEEDSGRELNRLQEFRDLPAETGDGIRVNLRANIGLISDVDVAKRHGAQGVGLYRTEFPYMTRSNFPDRETQYELYRRVVEGFAGQPVTIRTLDIGGDKALPYFNPPTEGNPFMGWRSVRVSLDNKDIFRTQIEAILMSGLHGPVKLLFPMISSLDEITECKAVIKEAQNNLFRENIPFAKHVPIGVMIEVPAAVTLAEEFAQQVDFFNLGTNDLIQYMLAADRNNPLVQKYYDPLHPAILQVLNHVSKVAIKYRKGFCLCGEMGSDPLCFLVLFGMGYRDFSMPSPYIPRTKAMMRDITFPVAQRVARKVLTMKDSSSIRAYLLDVLKTLENVQ